MVLGQLKTSIRTVKFDLNCKINDLSSVFDLVMIDNSDVSKTRVENSGSKKWLNNTKHLIAFVAFNKMERGYCSCKSFKNVLQLWVKSPLRSSKSESEPRKAYLHVKVSQTSITITGNRTMKEANLVAKLVIKEINDIRQMLDVSGELDMYYSPEYNLISDMPDRQQFRDINESVKAKLTDDDLIKVVNRIMAQPPMTEPELHTLLNIGQICDDNLKITTSQCTMCNYFYDLPMISFDEITKRIRDQCPPDVHVKISRSETHGAMLIINMSTHDHPKPTTFTITSPNHAMQSSPNEEIASHRYDLLDQMLTPTYLSKEEVDI